MNIACGHAIQQQCVGPLRTRRQPTLSRLGNVQHRHDRQIQPVAKGFQTVHPRCHSKLGIAKLPLDQSQVASRHAAEEDLATNLGRHQPAIEMARVEPGDGGRPLIAGEPGLGTKALDLLPFPAEHFHKGPENGAKSASGWIVPIATRGTLAIHACNK